MISPRWTLIFSTVFSTLTLLILILILPLFFNRMLKSNSLMLSQLSICQVRHLFSRINSELSLSPTKNFHATSMSSHFFHASEILSEYCEFADWISFIAQGTFYGASLEKDSSNFFWILWVNLILSLFSSIIDLWSLGCSCQQGGPGESGPRGIDGEDGHTLIITFILLNYENLQKQRIFNRQAFDPTDR